MTAAAARRALAAVGQDLVTSAGSAGERRGAALLAAADRRDVPSASLTDLADVPAWQRLPRPAQQKLARLAAVVAMAPAVAASIDGGWLGRLANTVGEDALDWAIEQADALPEPGAGPIDADRLDARGFDMLRTRLPAHLLGFTGWAPRSGETHPAPLAAACTALAEQRLAA